MEQEDALLEQTGAFSVSPSESAGKIDFAGKTKK